MPRARLLAFRQSDECREGRMHSGQAHLQGSKEFMRQTDLHPCLNAIVKVSKNGTAWAAVLNTLTDDVKLSRGQRYGTLTSTCDPTSSKVYPHRICVMDSGPKSKSSKASDYIKKFVDKAKADASSKHTSSSTPSKNPLDFSTDEKIAYLKEHFGLSDNPILKDPKDLDLAVITLLEFWDVFSHDGSSGTTSLLKHRIITEDVPPIKCKYRPINPALEPDLRIQLDKWLKDDVIEPANSPWSSNLVAAKKKGGRIRWCVDWRRLNMVTKKDSFPMPTVQDNLARLAGSEIFSGIDMAGAFHCVEMDERDREKTAFATPSLSSTMTGPSWSSRTCTSPPPGWAPWSNPWNHRTIMTGKPPNR